MNSLHKSIISALRYRKVAVTAKSLAVALQCNTRMITQSIAHINKHSSYDVGIMKRSDGLKVYWIDS